MGSSPFARTEKDDVEMTPRHLFLRELRDSVSPLTPLSLRDISPGRIYVSDVWSLALAQNGRWIPRRPLLRELRASRLLSPLSLT